MLSAIVTAIVGLVVLRGIAHELRLVLPAVVLVVLVVVAARQIPEIANLGPPILALMLALTGIWIVVRNLFR